MCVFYAISERYSKFICIFPGKSGFFSEALRLRDEVAAIDMLTAKTVPNSSDFSSVPKNDEKF